MNVATSIPVTPLVASTALALSEIPSQKTIAAVRVSNNEMRAVFYQDNLPSEVAARGQQTDPGIAGTTLIGPIPHEATATNRWK